MKIPVFDKRIDTEKIQITEPYQLKNGDIYVTIESAQPFSIASWGFEPPSENISPFSSYSNGLAILSLQRSFWSELFSSAVPMSKSSFVLPLKETETIGSDSKLPIHESSSIYFEGKHDKRILIWKNGQELDPAPDTIEEKVYHECQPAIDTDCSTKQNSLQDDSETENIFIFDDKMY